MKVSLDNGKTWHPVESVRVLYDIDFVPGEDGPGEYHVNHTREGLIEDVWASRDEPFDYNIGSGSVTIDERVSQLVKDGE